MNRRPYRRDALPPYRPPYGAPGAGSLALFVALGLLLLAAVVGSYSAYRHANVVRYPFVKAYLTKDQHGCVVWFSIFLKANETSSDFVAVDPRLCVAE